MTGATDREPGGRRLRWTSPGRFGLVVAVGLAALIRLWDAPFVFTAAGVQLTEDSDPHYHVLRAERWLRGDPGAPWRDPSLDWPHGADVPWPPLFDALVAAGGRLLGGPEPARDDLAAVAAVLPVAFALAAVLLAAALAATLVGKREAWIAALAVAVLPVASEYGKIGRGDQHAAELALSLALLLVFLRAVLVWSGRAARLAWAALAILVVLSFWTWMGSALSLVTPAAFAACAYVAWPGRAETRRAALALLLGVGGGAGLLAVSIAALGPAGGLARTGVVGVGGLHVAVATGVAAFGGLLLAAGRRGAKSGAARRLAEVALAAGTPALLALGLSPGLRGGAGRGLTALLAANPWYAGISEFKPFLLAGENGLPSELYVLLVAFGLFLPALAMTAPAWSSRWRERPEARPALLAIAVVVATAVSMALVRRRLGLYAAAPLGVAAALGLPWAGERVARRIPAGWPERLRSPWLATVILAALAAAPTIEHHLTPPARIPQPWIDGLLWLAGRPVAPGREGVAGQWQLGHLVQYYAGKPVLASPFGTEGGATAVEDWAGILLASDAALVERVLRERRVGYLVLQNPADEAVNLRGFAPADMPPAVRVQRDLWRGEQVEPTDAYWTLVITRLFLWAGQPPPGERERSLGAYRLLWESAGGPDDDEHLRIFGVVEGARVVVGGAAPGATVRAAIRLTAEDGRTRVWAGLALATGAGQAELRLPYATGVNGTMRAGVWAVSDGIGSATVEIAEEDVLLGGTVHVHLGRREEQGR